MFAFPTRRAMPGLALAASLAGCAGLQSTPSAVTPQAASATPMTASARQATRPNRSKSWMKPGVGSKKLLYVSDLFAATVDVYTYPGLTYAGQLTGFGFPTGMCSDKAGNVWITDQDAVVYEYAHGGTSPINVLSSGIVSPEGCAINLKTGDLAVANGNDQVLVFHNAAGTPTAYTDTNFMRTTFLGYDGQGNLFVDGADNSFGFHYAELPAGSSSFTDITLSASPSIAGNVQWDGTYMVIGDQGSTLYQTQGSTVAGTITLSTASLGQFYIVPSRKRVIVPDSGNVNVGIFHYPAGGAPMLTVTGGLQYPVGVALSQ